MAGLTLGRKSSLPSSITTLLTPLAALVVVIVLFIVVFKIGSSKIGSQRKQLQTSEKNEATLVQKQRVLQEVQEEILSYADVSSIAMPRENPVLVVFSQLKRLAERNSIILSDLRVGSQAEDKKGFSKATVSFEIEGEFRQILNYLISIGGFAPLSTVDGVEINQVAGAIRATVDMAFFWAPFPEKLPPISESIDELTAEEIDLIVQFSDLEQPVFTEVSAQAPITRENPFSF